MMGTGETGIGAGLRATFTIAVAIVGTLATFTTIAAFFGDIWWGFDLAANYRWQLMWLALIASVLYSISTSGIATIIFLGAAIVNGFLIAPLWTSSQPTATGEDGITVVHADLSGGVSNMRFTLRWLFDSGGDLIFLAGITEERARPLIADGSPYVLLAGPDANSTGIVILGKDQWNVTTTSTDEGELVYRVSVPSGSDVIDIITAYGDMGTSKTDSEDLAARLEAISDSINATTNPVAVIGNVGATPWTKGMRDLLATANLRNAAEGFGYLSTAPVSSLPLIGGWVGIPIDVVLMDSTLTPLELDTGPDLGASHLPVTVVVGPAFES